MSLLLHIIVTYIKENIITKLQNLCSLPRNPRAGNKSLALLVKKPLCTGDLSPVRKIFIERPDVEPKHPRFNIAAKQDLPLLDRQIDAFEQPLSSIILHGLLV